MICPVCEAMTGEVTIHNAPGTLHCSACLSIVQGATAVVSGAQVARAIELLRKTEDDAFDAIVADLRDDPVRALILRVPLVFALVVKSYGRYVRLTKHVVITVRNPDETGGGLGQMEAWTPDRWPTRVRPMSLEGTNEVPAADEYVPRGTEYFVLRWLPDDLLVVRLTGLDGSGHRTTEIGACAGVATLDLFEPSSRRVPWP